MNSEQLALDLELPAPPARPRLYLVPLGDRRAATRLDPYGEHGLEDGDAEVIVRGWVHVALGRL